MSKGYTRLMFPAAAPIFLRMTAKDIRALIHRIPFKPFRLHLADGKSLRVPHQDFILAGVELAVVANELPQGVPGELNLIPYEHIVRIELLGRKAAKAA